MKNQIQQLNTYSKLTIEKIEQGVQNTFKINNKNSRATTSFCSSIAQLPSKHLPA